MKSEIEKLSAELHGEKLGIETLKKIQAVKAKIIKQAYTTHEAIKQGKKGLAVALGWVDEAVAFFALIGQHKKIAAEWQDLDVQEKEQLQSYFIECLKKEGFAGEQPELIQLVAASNLFAHQTQEYFKLVAEFVKK